MSVDSPTSKNVKRAICPNKMYYPCIRQSTVLTCLKIVYYAVSGALMDEKFNKVRNIDRRVANIA